MKKILLIIIFILSFNIRTFAESGFVAILNVPVGLSIGIPIGVHVGETLNKLDVNAGVNTKLGYMFDFGKLGFTPLLELGYSYDTYGYSYFQQVRMDGSSIRVSLNESINTHSIQIGLIPKFNIDNFAIGLGFGLKIPLYAIYSYKGAALDNKNEYYIESGEEGMDTKDIANKYRRVVIPYLKLSFDYYFAITEKIAIGVGTYVGYDFGFTSRDSNEERLDSLDISLQLGLRFGPGIEKEELPKIKFNF